MSDITAFTAAGTSTRSTALPEIAGAVAADASGPIEDTTVQSGDKDVDAAPVTKPELELSPRSLHVARLEDMRRQQNEELLVRF